MSEQLTNTGVSGLLAMLGATPAATGPLGATPPGGVLPFGAIMQAQGVGITTAQLDANGQPLPQSGGILPPSGEMLAQMQAQIDTKARAPELSQTKADMPEANLRASLLSENQSIRDGVVFESQWPGVLPANTEIPLESPDVVALLQTASEDQESAQQRLTEAMGTLQLPATTVANENGTPLAETPRQVKVEGVGEEKVEVGEALQDSLKVANTGGQTTPIVDPGAVPDQVPERVVIEEVRVHDLQQDEGAATGSIPPRVEQSASAEAAQPVAFERPDFTSASGPEPQEATVNPLSQPDEQMLIQEELDMERIASQIASLQQVSEAPVIDGQGAAATVANVLRESQSAKHVDSAPRVSEAVTGFGAAKDSSIAAAVTTQLHTPVQNQAAPVQVSVTPGQASTQDGMPPPIEGRSSATVDVDASTRQPSTAANDAPLGADESADSWSRAEARTTAQPNAAADSVARMTPSQVAFTLAGKGMMGSPAWNQALNERVMIMTAQNNQVAEIQLDPPELGTLKVRLHVGQDQVNVSFTSPHASVRDAVEQSMPRLREMMEEQGLSLGESSVNDQSSESDENERRQGFASQGNAEGSEGVGEVASAPGSGEAVSLVDYYA